MAAEPLRAIKVIGVRYRGCELVADDGRALDAYGSSGVFAAAGVPFEVVEPRIPEHARTGNDADDVGLLGGVIAGEVASARRGGEAVLLVGGNCSHATGVVGGLLHAHGPGARVGLVWLDAHGDFNTPETTLSGSLGGMPVAVCAGLAHDRWRELSLVTVPLAAERILLVDARNLDVAERKLMEANGIVVASIAPGFPGANLEAALRTIVECSDIICLHVDCDILDESLVPNHRTREPHGPDVAQVAGAIETVMATGIVAAYAVVSVPGGSGSETSVASGVALIRAGLESWTLHGTAGCPVG